MEGVRLVSTHTAALSAIRKVIVIAFFVAVMTPACRRNEPEKTSAADSSSDAAKSQRPNLLIFPDELRVTDSTVNEYVVKAMTTCAVGEYEAFRLLWSARETPLPREEFEQGWQAVQNIQVRALEQVLLDADPSADRTQPETVYALLIEVALDPAQKVGQKEPRRLVVLMLTREHEQWRLATAPKPMREWVKKIIAEPSVDGAPSTVPQPKGD